MTKARRALGVSGEAAAAEWYEREGYEVLARNWRCREGEIDLILRRKGTIVFCEVKTRTSTAFGVPAEAVTLQKQRRLRKLAARWLSEESSVAEGTRRGGELRFDVASVMKGTVEILEAAF